MRQFKVKMKYSGADSILELRIGPEVYVRQIPGDSAPAVVETLRDVLRDVLGLTDLTTEEDYYGKR